jgi:hypothetical protein
VFGKLEKKRNKRRKKKENNSPPYLLGPKAVERPVLSRLPAWAAQRRSGPAAEPSNQPSQPRAFLFFLSLTGGGRSSAVSPTFSS